MKPLRLAALDTSPFRGGLYRVAAAMNGAPSDFSVHTKPTPQGVGFRVVYGYSPKDIPAARSLSFSRARSPSNTAPGMPVTMAPSMLGG